MLDRIKKYRDIVYIGVIILFGAVMVFQCSKSRKLDSELDRQENNRIALTEKLSTYEDELGRMNAEKHAFQLKQEELRDSVGLLKKKNYEYVSYINGLMNIRDTVIVETTVIKTPESAEYDGRLRLDKSDRFGKSSRTVGVEIPYSIRDSILTAGNGTINMEQDIFTEGWLERNTKTGETVMHLRTDYPGVEFNSGMGIVAENGKSYERSMRKTFGIGISVGPSVGMYYDWRNGGMIPTVGIGITVGFNYTPKAFQW